MSIRSMWAMAVFGILVAVVRPAEAHPPLAVHVGPNLGSTRYDDPMPAWDPGWDVGFSAGASTELGVRDRLLLVPEIRYLRIKNRVGFHPPYEGEFHLTHEYLSVPVALRLRAIGKTLCVDAGPDLSLLLSAKSEGEVRNPEFEVVTDLTRGITGEMRRWAASLFGGVAFDASSLGPPIEIRLRYVAGVTGAAKEGEWWSNWKTREVAVALAWKVIR